MKKYMMGLGAMLVGAGLMFVLMHGEVSAEDESNIPEPFVCSTNTTFEFGEKRRRATIINCKTKHLDCGFSFINGNVSCIKK
jgi:NAD(P)H-hydrate repair Nnr-like enzyme with NAD(P)H-hydrate dehydratase domain